jgi:hypothetical protein
LELQEYACQTPRPRRRAASDPFAGPARPFAFDGKGITPEQAALGEALELFERTENLVQARQAHQLLEDLATDQGTLLTHVFVR